MQEPLLFYRCAFEGLQWQRSLYSHVATKSVLQGFLDRHLCSAAQLVVCTPYRAIAVYVQLFDGSNCGYVLLLASMLPGAASKHLLSLHTMKSDYKSNVYENIMLIRQAFRGTERPICIQILLTYKYNWLSVQKN